MSICKIGVCYYAQSATLSKVECQRRRALGEGYARPEAAVRSIRAWRARYEKLGGLGSSGYDGCDQVIALEAVKEQTRHRR